MTSPSMAEIMEAARRVFVDEKRYLDFQREIRDDMQRIEEGQRRLLWGLVSVLVAVVVQVVLLVVQRGIFG